VSRCLCSVCVFFSPHDRDEEEVELGITVGGSFVTEETPEEAGLAGAVGFGIPGDGGEDVEGDVAVEFLVVHQPP